MLNLTKPLSLLSSTTAYDGFVFYGYFSCLSLLFHPEFNITVNCVLHVTSTPGKYFEMSLFGIETHWNIRVTTVQENTGPEKEQVF